MRRATLWLLIVNAGVFVVQSVLDYYTPVRLAQYGALDPVGLFHGKVWQLLTFQFLHVNFMHLLLNSLGIYFFGRAIEEALGMASFLKLYLLSGVAGGVLQAVFGLWLPGHFGVRTVGASAGVFGLIAAVATLSPEQPLTMLVSLIIPVTLRAKYLLLICGLLALFGMLVPRDNMAHAAHLGGMLAAMAYVVWVVRPVAGLFRLGQREAEEPPRELVSAPSARKSRWRKQGQIESDSLSPSDFISREVDPILDKISAQGIHSLTPRERRILEEARSKMGRK
jgi:membrane associated rhomboid family serine protease